MEVHTMTSPIRTCLGCRKRVNREELIRIVASNAQVLPDVARTFPGRGAYLHQRSECIKNAVDRRLIARALRIQAPIDTLQLELLVTTNTVLTAKSGV